MKGSTHLSAGLAAGLALSLYSNIPPVEAAVITLLSGIGSLAPDLDIASSIIGRKLPITSRLANILFGHRTVLHALIPWTVVLYLLWQVLAAVPFRWAIIVGAAIGILSHLSLDMLNPSGIPLFWPLRSRLGFGLFRSGGAVDRMIGKILAFLVPLLIIIYCSAFIFKK